MGDMVHYMKEVAKMDRELNPEERALISVAFKQSLTLRRTAWREIAGEEQRDPGSAAKIAEYRRRVEAEIANMCQDILATLDAHLIPKVSEADAKTFFLKMKG